MHRFSFVDEVLQTKSPKRQGEENDFKHMSDEIVLRVLSYLSKADLNNCGLADRRFRQLSLDETLWKRLDLGGKSISCELLHRLMSRGIQFLRLARATIAGTFHPKPPPPIPCRLRFLDLSMMESEDPHIIYEILYRCNDLIAVSLEKCVLNEPSFKALARNKNLRVLNLASAHGVSTTGVQRILAACRQLEQLNVAWTKLDRAGAVAICTAAPSTLIGLNVSGCREGVLFDDDMAALCNSCPKLVDLDISDAGDLTHTTIAVLANMAVNLQTLSCSRCYKVDPLAYGTLPPLLKELNLFNSIQDGSWESFMRMIPEGVKVNVNPFSTIARPTVGLRRTSIWGYRVRDE